MAITPITNPSGNNNLPSAPQQQQQQQQQKIKAASNSSNSINRNENVKIDKEWISIRSEIRASVSRARNYEAQIKFKGKSRNIGTFKYARDAALAYEIAKRRVQVPPILQRSDKEWKLIRSEVKAIIENENTVDNCKKRNIGTFKDERDAALAFKVAKRKVEALQQQLLPSSSSSSNNNNNNNNNRSREMRSFNPTLTMILNNNSNNNHNIAKTNYKENGSSPTTTTTSGSSSNLSSGGNAVVNHKKRKSTIDDDKDCDYDKDCDCDKHRASISSTTLLEDGIDTDGPDGQSSKRTLICREIAREVVGQSPYERRILDMIKNGVDPTTASHLSLYGMILPPQTQTKTQTQTQTLYGESIATMATLITDPSGNNSHPSSWVDNDPGANADDDGDASDVEDYHDALMEIDSNDNNSNKGEEKDDAST
ncbi:hypothetical protein FRACYDRAFT_236372 [Fragilariopsis cylindrus CCMP1102]|uniref:60S ribosomal protein L36 n=1 Tax=Fragilariopsis cylindrus CCMP1102 TaxID=635003 RepID=A0A1E7FQ84_9STRA|nr:hypothetical protein FRACYDRAFT_236372 [Fragilariopsis cylindrus CCMP1102]|eukprot:OEU20297.1 hypothetical protein FRACYDRAFT_236372 [Fragilariopsis cylindrus CCMP1102]